MFGSVKEWIAKTFLIRGLKAALDKIPLDYKKTVIGIIGVALTESVRVLCVSPVPEYCSYLGYAGDAIASYGQVWDDANVAAWTALITGIIHKVLKWTVGEPTIKKPAEKK